MIINWKKLIKLPVFTEQGLKLGKVIDINFDIDNFLITQITVASWFKPNLLIDISQMVSISNEKIIVTDTAITVPVEQVKKSLATENISPAIEKTFDN